MNDYLQLIRFDKPIGTFLLLWPTYWALWLASNGAVQIYELSLFFIGTFIMRSAGCVINDFFDRKIDIHIENLLDNFYHMSNYEIVNYQLDKCENIIHKALKAKVHKLVIIHGKGQGVLRKEVHNLLYSFRLDFKDSDYMRYSGGATDVFFR